MAKLIPLYPDLIEKLSRPEKYELDFPDINEYANRLEPNVFYTGSKSEQDRSDEINKDTHRNAFEQDCHLNIFTKKHKNIKLTYPVNPTTQDTISLASLNFEDDDLLGKGEDDETTQILKHKILLIIHMLYTRRLQSLITECNKMNNRDLQEEIVSVLRDNGIHFKFLKLYRKKKTILEIRKLLRNIHLTTLIFDQNMFGDFMRKILFLHGNLINVDPEKMFFEGIFQKRIPEMRKSKMTFNISPTGDIISVDLGMQNTFLFLANSKNINSGGEAVSKFDHLGNMKEVKALSLDTVQYRLDSNFEVCLTYDKSPTLIQFNLESFLPTGFKVPRTTFLCRREPFKPPVSETKKTKKRKGKRTKKKK